MALLNPCIKSKIFWLLLKHNEDDILEKYPLHVPGSAKPRIHAGKTTKGDFLKKALVRIDFFVVLGSYESLKGLKR